MNYLSLCLICNEPLMSYYKFCPQCGLVLYSGPVGGTLGMPSKPPTEASTKQIGGSHYQGAAVQHWDFVKMHGIPYMEAQIIKYLMRWPKKGGVQDLEKAKHFLEKLIEQQA